MKNTPKYSRALLSLAVVWSSVGNAIPAFAAELEAVPGLRPVTAEPVKIPGALNAEIPSLPAALTPASGFVPVEMARLAQAAQPASVAATPSAAAAQTAAAKPGLQSFGVSAQTAQTAEASAEKPGVFARLAQAAGQILLNRGSISWAAIFDSNRSAPANAMGIRPLPKPNLPNGFNLGDAPKAPDPKKVRTVNITANAIDAPGARGAGGIFDSGPRVLNASVRGTQEEIEASVKEALLRMVDNDAAKWGVTRSELKEVHVRYVPAEGDQIGQVFAYFQQQRKTTNQDGTTQDVVVHGTSLSFTVNIVKNQPILMAASAKLYPNLNVATRATKSDDELKQGAEGQLRQMPQGADISLVFSERRIVYHEGAWHTVNLYDIDGLGQYVGVKVAIDIASGEIFAWDSRVGMRAGAPTAAPEQGRFAIAYRGVRPLTDEERAAMKEFLSRNGMTLATEGNGGALLVVDGPVENMAKIVGNPIFRGWTIHRYNAPKMGYPEPSARVEAARAVVGKDAKLIGAAANFLNKSNIWAYRFYIPSTNMVQEVYVNFLGKTQTVDPRPAPSDTDFNEIDLNKIIPLELAYKSAFSLGAKPTGVRIERRQALVGGHPVQFIFTDGQGRETVVPAAAAASLQAETAASEQTPDAAVGGVFQANAETSDHRNADGSPILVVQSTPHLKFTLDGKAGEADVDGKFSGNGKTIAATVESTWAKVKDTDRKELKVNVSLIPGSDNKIVINPTQNDENAINQVNMLIWITRIHDWWSSRLKGDKRIDKQIPVNVNIHQDCNAYYTPGRPSLNFFRSSEECSDTGKPGVGAHEYGHFVDDMIGGITNGGMSEGWGDIGSMFLLKTPIIGEGFLKHRDPSWIRHGENTYQYNENDEVHDQGQAWMGFAWKLRKALVASLDEARGAAIAEDLIVPTLFAKASDIPSQMAQVLLRAMSNDGTIRYEKEIRAAAKAHGIDLPQNPGIVGGVADLANGLVGIVTGGDGVSVEEVASGTFEGANALVPEGFGQGSTDAKVVTKTFSLKAGRKSRDEIRAKLAGAYKYRSGDYHDLGFKLEEQKGWRGSQFTVTITGSEKAIEYMTKQIKRIGGEKEAEPSEKPPVSGNELRLGGSKPEAGASGSGPATMLAEAQPAPPTWTWKDEIQVGGLLRGRFKSAFIQYCEREDLKYSITEDRHLLYSVFYVKVEGPKEKVQALYEWVQRLSRDSSFAASLASNDATSGLNAGAAQDEAPMLKPLVEGWTVGGKTYGSTAELVASLPASDAPVDAVYRYAHTDKAPAARPWANAGVGLVSGSLIGGAIGLVFAAIGSAIGPILDILLGGSGAGTPLAQALIIPAVFSGFGAFMGAMIGREESRRPADPGTAISGKIYRNAGPSGTTLYFESGEAWGGVRVDLGRYAQAQPLPAPATPARLSAWKSAALGAGWGLALAASQWIPLVQIIALPFAGPALGAAVGSALSRGTGVAGGVLGGSLGLLVPVGALLSFAAAGQFGILAALGGFVAALAVVGGIVGLFAMNSLRAAGAADAAQSPAGQWWVKATKAGDRS